MAAQYNFNLTGNELEYGNATGKTGTDRFTVYGPNNTIVEQGGNLIVNGGSQSSYGWDTATTIVLDDTSGNKNQANEKIKINLQGSHNSISGNDSIDNSFTGKTVDFANLNQATVTITVGGHGSAAGHNTVGLYNYYGSNTVNLAGTDNSIYLNGDAENAVTAGSGHDTVTISSDPIFGDDDYPAAYFNSSVKLAGSSNQVFGGDSKFTVTGGVDGNTVALGDGNDSVSLSGANNSISVWGGVDTINAGSGNDTVNILGLDGSLDTTFVADDDSPAKTIPIDQVTLAGTMDVVNATYEDVVVNGASTTGAASVTLGNGNNQVTLGGDANTVSLGDGSLSGTNTVSLTGNNNSVVVNDGSNDTGTTAVSLGTGTGDSVTLGYAGGTVTGTGTGTTTVTQNTASNANVTVGLGNGTGLVTLGGGNDRVTANGAGTSVTAGDGNDTVTANGGNVVVTLGKGNDTVTANGGNTTVTAGDGKDSVSATGKLSSVTLGNGNDTVNAGSGFGSTVTVGNGNDLITANGNLDSVTGGTGSDTVTANGKFATVTLGVAGSLDGSVNVTATGLGAQVTVYASSSSHDTFTVGNNNTFLRVSGGDDTIGPNGNNGDSNDNFYLNNAQAGSSIDVFGTNDMLFLGTNSSAHVNLGLDESGNTVTVQGNADNSYTGTVELSGFGPAETLDLQGLDNPGGTMYTNFGQVVSSLHGTSNSETLDLKGGGSIVFDQQTGFTSNEFQFTTLTGAV